MEFMYVLKNEILAFLATNLGRAISVSLPWNGSVKISACPMPRALSTDIASTKRDARLQNEIG